MRILVVEDNEDSRQLQQVLLEGSGYEVEVAGNGREALELARSHPPDLIISDILMPEMDGFELCRLLKTDPVLQSIPFIFYTATYTDAQDERLALSLGASRFILKPMEPAAFLAVLLEVIEQHGEKTLPVPKGPLEEPDSIEELYSSRVAQKLEKKMAELQAEREALRVSEERFRGLVESLREHYFFYSHGKDGIFTYVSPSIRNVLGYDPEEFFTHFAQYLTDNPVNARAERFTRLALQGELQPPYELEIFHRNGGRRWLEVTEFPLLGKAGEVLAVEGIAQDITERRLAEASFQRTYRALSTLYRLNQIMVQAVSEGELLADVCRLMVETGEYRFAWVGFVDSGTGGAISVRPVASWGSGEGDGFLHRGVPIFESGDAADDAVARVVAGESFCVEKNACRAAGVLPWQAEAQKAGCRHSIVLPLSNHHGVFGVLALYADTENAFDEDETQLLTQFAQDVVYGIKGIRAAAERKRAEAAREEMEARLRRSQKLESIGTLAGGIAHDFNNILSAIIGFSDLALLSLAPDSPVCDYIEQIRTAGQRAARMTRQILAFSREGEHGKEPIQLYLIVKEALKLLRSTTPATIGFCEQVNAPELVVLADPTQMHQVVVNLCTNAVYAMRDKGGQLSVTLRPVTLDEEEAAQHQLPEGDYALFIVEDSGHGMRPEVLERIFDPYFTTKPSGEGTGLGLAVVHGIVAAHGGAISVESELDRGTVFSVYLPVTTEVQAREEQAVTLPGGREGILLVDDEEPIVQMGQKMLQKLGYRVRSCNAGAEALELLKGNPDGWDLVLTDLAMPGISGLELARQMLEVRPNLPIILCSGFLDEQAMFAAGRIGVQEVVPKPIVWAEVAPLIRRVLDGKKEGADKRRNG